MSAGDVLFIGWKGTTPLTQEMPPAISTEPIRALAIDEWSGRRWEFTSNFLWQKITRRIKCFTADRELVLQQLKTSNTELTLPYIDTNGAAQTKSAGGGWYLETIDESPAGTGYSLLTISYRRLQAKAFNYDLPANLSITCAAGMASIIYKTTTLETLDNATGLCGEGLIFVADRFDPVRFRAGPSASPIDAEAFNSRVYARATLYVGTTAFDEIAINGAQVTARASVWYDRRLALPGAASSGTATTALAADTAANTYLADNRLTEAEKTALLASYAAIYPNREYTTHTVSVSEVAAKSVEAAGPVFLWSAELVRTITVRETYNLPSGTIDPRIEWRLEGNNLRLYFGAVIWRDYDISGL
jgi:hypothetical protein